MRLIQYLLDRFGLFGTPAVAPLPKLQYAPPPAPPAPTPKSLAEKPWLQTVARDEPIPMVLSLADTAAYDATVKRRRAMREAIEAAGPLAHCCVETAAFEREENQRWAQARKMIRAGYEPTVVATQCGFTFEEVKKLIH